MELELLTRLLALLENLHLPPLIPTQ